MDVAPAAIVLIGLPEMWLENITLENITVRNAERGARITRVKNLNMKNVDIESNDRAMVIHDVYEATLDHLVPRDNTDGAPLAFEGRHTGAIFSNDFPRAQMEFNDGLTAEIIKEEPVVQAW